MHDTSPEIAMLMAERHRRMTPEARMRVMSAMFDCARTIVGASLPAGLSESARRFAIAKRIYGDDLPLAALEAHAVWTGSGGRNAADRIEKDAGFPLSQE